VHVAATAQSVAEGRTFSTKEAGDVRDNVVSSSVLLLRYLLEEMPRTEDNGYEPELLALVQLAVSTHAKTPSAQCRRALLSLLSHVCGSSQLLSVVAGPAFEQLVFAGFDSAEAPGFELLVAYLGHPEVARLLLTSFLRVWHCTHGAIGLFVHLLSTSFLHRTHVSGFAARLPSFWSLVSRCSRLCAVMAEAPKPKQVALVETLLLHPKNGPHCRPRRVGVRVAAHCRRAWAQVRKYTAHAHAHAHTHTHTSWAQVRKYTRAHAHAHSTHAHTHITHPEQFSLNTSLGKTTQPSKQTKQTSEKNRQHKSHHKCRVRG
jgi:hypothetical protein